jgi:c-di-GMP-binding flagellar brake protein YcgR
MKLILDAEPKNSRGEAIPLLVGDFVSVNFIGPDQVCALTFKIVEKKMDGQITLMLRDAGRSEEHPRRQHFRLSTMEDMRDDPEAAEAVGKIKAFVREAGNPEKLYRTKMINISGGGMLFAFYDDMPHLNSIFDIEINIGGARVFPVKGKLARIERKLYENEMVFMVGVNFLEIDETDREAIINFVFDEGKKSKPAAN